MTQDKQNNRPNVPPLRFPEFSGEWEKHLTTDFFEFKNGLNPDVKRFGSGTKFISVMDILNNRYITYDKIISSVEAKDDDLRDFGVNYGDILFQRSSETLEDVGRANVYLDEKPALFGGFVIRGKRIGDYNPLFFRYLLSSPSVRKRIIVKGAGAQHFNIGQDGLSKVSLFVPSAKEQDRIAQLLNAIDKRIEVQSGLINKLESLIGGIRRKLFDEQQNCKLCRLGDFLVEYSERNMNRNLTSVAVGKYGIRKREDIYSRELSKDYSKNKVIKKNTLTIGMGSSQIDIGVLLEDVEYCVSPAYTTYKIHGINSAYLQEYLILINPILSFKYMVTSVRQGKSVNKDELMKHKISVCSLSDQQKIQLAIAAFYKKLGIEQQVLDLYIKQKQYLLSQMFI